MSVVRNLTAGFRLACFARVEASDFRVGADPLVALVGIWLMAAMGCSFALTEAPRWFDVAAFETQAFTGALILVFGWLAARESERPDAALAIAVAYLATEPLTWFAFTAAHLTAGGLLAEVPIRLEWAIWIGVQSWEGWIAYRAVRVMCGLEPLRTGALAGLYLTASVWLSFSIPGSAFFLTDTWTAAAAESEVLDIEGILNDQHRLVSFSLDAVEEQRPGTPDLYFVGFGADATQDVFRGEVEYTQELFDRRFDTAGRSIALVNHADTLVDVPLASVSNLEAVLHGLGQRLDPEEDVLFLYLTGHGSEEHDIVVRHPGLPLKVFGPERLRGMLDEAGIQWRVLVVSACYSGGFIEPLQDEHTLVLTASAADRQSFGCGTESDFTYFGRALFADQLSRKLSIPAAFEAARRRIADREKEEGLQPSRPQMAAAEPILGKLSEIEARLREQEPTLARVDYRP